MKDEGTYRFNSDCIILVKFSRFRRNILLGMFFESSLRNFVISQHDFYYNTRPLIVRFWFELCGTRIYYPFRHTPGCSRADQKRLIGFTKVWGTFVPTLTIFVSYYIPIILKKPNASWCRARSPDTRQKIIDMFDLEFRIFASLEFRSSQ